MLLVYLGMAELTKGIRRGARLMNASDAYRLLSPSAEGLEREHGWRLDLDRDRFLLGCELVSVGTAGQVRLPPAAVFRGACCAAAAKIMVLHNHPSGIIEPSDWDLGVTRRLRICGLYLGIELVDHVVIGKGKYFSFKERGLL